MNYGASTDWLEPGLFVLRSVEHFKNRFGIEDFELCEAEVWALSQVLKRLQELHADRDTSTKDSLGVALSQYDARLAAFLKKQIPLSQ